jgi:hypothetical protein
VEYPLAPEHPFPAGLNAAADAIHWLLHDSGETADYFVGELSAGFSQHQQQQCTSATETVTVLFWDTGGMTFKLDECRPRD